MENRKIRLNQSVGSLCVVLCLLVYAYYAREWERRLSDSLGKTVLSLSRHLIHAGLIFCWILSVNARIIQDRIRGYLTAIGGLLIFWLYIRTVKWMFFLGDSWQNQYLWYAYYIPMILIPLIGVFLVQYLGKKETYRLSGTWRLLYLPAFFLIGLVFSNGFHQQVFSFPEGRYSGSVYSYEAGYYFVMAWCLLLGLYFIVMLLFKCRAPGKRWFQKLPLFVLLANVFLSVLYCLKIIRMDLVAVDCMFIVVLLEACIQSGLIRSNSGYEMLFASALMEAQILNKNGMVCYTSHQAEKMDENTRSRMKDPENKGLILENRRLNCADIANGRIFWWENVEEVLRYTHKLEETNERLREENDLLDAEMKLREAQLQIDEQNRLYDQLTCDMKEQLDLLEGLLKSDRVTGRQRIAKICVLSAYMKRRSNLCLLAESEKKTSTKELELCISESLESMRLCNLFCSFESHCSGKTAAGELILLYDVVQQIFQQLLADAGAVMIWLRAENDSLFLKLQSDGRLCTEFPAMERWSAAGGSFSVSCGPDAAWLILQKEGGKG